MILWIGGKLELWDVFSEFVYDNYLNSNKIFFENIN